MIDEQRVAAVSDENRPSNHEDFPSPSTARRGTSLASWYQGDKPHRMVIYFYATGEPIMPALAHGSRRELRYVVLPKQMSMK